MMLAIYYIPPSLSATRHVQRVVADNVDKALSLFFELHPTYTMDTIVQIVKETKK